MNISNLISELINIRNIHPDADVKIEAIDTSSEFKDDWDWDNLDIESLFYHGCDSNVIITPKQPHEERICIY